MKSNLLKVVLGIVLMGCALVVIFHSRHTPEVPSQTSVTNNAVFLPAAYKTNRLITGMRAGDMTPEQWAELEKRFNERMKPAIDKWAKAYTGHLPFDPTQVTVTNFHSVLAGGYYTFMLGSDTFTVIDNRKQTSVFYYMQKQAALALNRIPKDGAPRNLTMPVKADEILKMANADRGNKYELKDVVIRPTAAFCDIDGGESVDVGLKYSGGNILLGEDNLSFTMDSNGMIVSYIH